MLTAGHMAESDPAGFHIFTSGCFFHESQVVLNELCL